MRSPTNSLLPSMRLSAALAAACALVAADARADDFGVGSVIIPMDTTYQDAGMFRAYGLVYELLRNDVPVHWAIRQGKAAFEEDFTASATSYPSGTPITAHGYRGGPWVIDAADAAAALAVIDSWRASYPETAAHVASAPFSTDVAKTLVTAPRIAMFADGNQKIARGYLQAAGIPDSTGDLGWPDTSPDMLDVDEVTGTSTTVHDDGALFDEDGDPVYCQFMSMHWKVGDAEDNPDVVAEVRSFLNHPTHFFAECQAVNAFENLVPHGFFLTPNGFEIEGRPGNVELHNADSPFVQVDGAFATQGGSEPAYSLPAGDSYKAGGITMITAAGYAEGEWDVWMTGYLDGVCPPNSEVCSATGKVSYLGAHEYDTDLPISTHPGSQGTRLFLNSLFDSYCATIDGEPSLTLMKYAPETTSDPTITYSIAYWNNGPTVSLEAYLVDVLPPGAVFVSATGGGQHSAGVVTWDLGNLGVAEAGDVQVTVTFDDYGSYENQATLSYVVGVNDRLLDSNVTTTLYDADTDSDGVVDSLDICPDDYNPDQDLDTDVLSCGECGVVCTTPNGQPACVAGTCEVGWCDAGLYDCNGEPADGCEVAEADFETDPANCGDCNIVCELDHATADCTAGDCTLGACDPGYYDDDGDPSNGCEYACTPSGGSDPTCDGADDDCDGDVDDDYVAVTCGQGVCESTSTCIGGLETCVPTEAQIEGPPGDSSCSDGLDNDCDDLVDALDADCSQGQGGDGGVGGAGGAGAGGAGAAGGTGGSGGVAGAGGAGGEAGAGAIAGSGGSGATGGEAGSGAVAGSGGSGAVGAAGTGGSGATGATGASAPGGSAGAGASGAGAGPAGGAGAQEYGGAGAEPPVGPAPAAAGDEGSCGCRVPSSGGRHGPRTGWLAAVTALWAVRRRRARRAPPS